ncbi:alternative ribosome rescue aminoacyl-tRNA hydrolase ArfB [Tenacibaculum maritimum]|uniref:alternative ribosome rescue aminoacyl-tRNA hydrolase ArfB n=1 Tax=Tenacibaculum maritimum TaxID=107401 RepID=UPI0012E6A903|nr:alternative ribosome rescue aminoacyl-tRNA hydrolase ArfB [Tenacibaculum maritimum]MCD9562279.1 aminoacyl-tRNA hydrolase [Tenacibaculum maritimum]MCD9565822.1 aminoacyl-tRNA hydrolase [Tenacibaculum maritimum]MCD9577979.1 aminoacyl-tRNA hydrolase [Tenacibaculum maritimum]MCD9597100.1 aminoacyl-tRNA hydrolase [Tenacibaculum maritimum]MCD9613657.1 aminoacyl-tRNA hydrolase [Tenacibaculum maritimum]
MNIENLIRELQFKAVRSSGAGGQHVNKVSSKVVLSFDLHSSLSLSSEEKELISKRLKNRLTKSSCIVLECGETRSQYRNKEIVIQRFIALIKIALTATKRRKATKPTKASVRKRLQKKQTTSLKKQLRQKPRID